jgi:hypothetical protein
MIKGQQSETYVFHLIIAQIAYPNARRTNHRNRGSAYWRSAKRSVRRGERLISPNYGEDAERAAYITVNPRVFQGKRPEMNAFQSIQRPSEV